MGLLSNIVCGVADEVIKAIVETNAQNTQRDIAISKHNRDVKIAQTAAMGGVAVAGIAALGAVAYKALSNKNDKEKLEEQRTEDKLIADDNNEQNAELLEAHSADNDVDDNDEQLSIDENSVWIDRKNNQFGADIINKDNEIVNKIVYTFQNIGGKAYRIYGSVDNSDWEQVGTVDWSKMNISDLGNQENGGPAFATVLKAAISLPR